MLSVFAVVFSGIVLSGCDIPGTLSARAHSAVKDMMVDPWSAQFKSEFKSKLAPDTYCGLVNSKNRMGAYVGFSPYVFVKGEYVAITDGSPDFEKLVLSSESYSSLRYSDVKEEVSNECDALEAWVKYCVPESAVTYADTFESCKLAKGSIRDVDSLKWKIMGH